MYHIFYFFVFFLIEELSDSELDELDDFFSSDFSFFLSNFLLFSGKISLSKDLFLFFVGDDGAVRFPSLRTGGG